MSLILCLDTATAIATVCLCDNGIVGECEHNGSPKQHGAFLSPAIDSVLWKSGKTFKALDAVAVTIGPGSYTGLRVALSTAKGICFGLNVPLVTVPTLQAMAFEAVDNCRKAGLDLDALTFCPMIDARRMEVFVAKYDKDLNEIEAQRSLVLDRSFLESLENQRVVFTGNGSGKVHLLGKAKNHLFAIQTCLKNALALIAKDKLIRNDVTDHFTVVPHYMKEPFVTKKPDFA